MTAKLLIREVGQREFVAHNGEYPDAPAAATEGERVCREGSGEAFQVWVLVTQKQRVWGLEDIPEVGT